MLTLLCDSNYNLSHHDLNGYQGGIQAIHIYKSSYIIADYVAPHAEIMAIVINDTYFYYQINTRL